jgi:glycosyltransferase involved in cell wall biosynthesis
MRYTGEMEVIIEGTRASSILFNGKFYDTKRPIELSFSDAFRMTRYADIKTDYGNVPYDPSLWKEKKFVNFIGDIDGISGFGGVSSALIHYNPDIQTALVSKVFNVNDPTIFAAQHRDLNQAGAMIWHDQPREQWLYSPFKKNIAILPFETTKIPRSWIGKLEGFDALFTPCKQNIKMFRDSGITIPIELIHWGVDETKYYPIERPSRDTFTFGHMGALSYRKGTDVLVDAFQKAFPTEKDVRLICKSSYNTYPFGVNDYRVSVHRTAWTHEELMEQFFKQIDCFVFPTRGEGFGLTPLEAMATGVPAIVTGWSGPMEYMTPEIGWTIGYTMTPANNFTNIVYKEDCGDWAEPSLDDLIRIMRHAYENRDETRAKGVAAAKYVQENWLWKQQVSLYRDALEKHL